MMPNAPSAWKTATLVLAAHGSARNPGSRVPTERLAEDLRRRDCFAAVQTCYLKEPPFLAGALASVATDVVYVVPNFAAAGYITRVQVPAALGLTGPVSHIAGRRVHYTEPVGTHPGIPQLLRRRIDAILAAEALAAASVAVLLVGHGSSRPGAAGTTEAVAGVLRRDAAYGEVLTAYLEQEPRVAAWAERIGQRDVIVAPLLIAEGLHGSEDLPPLFGLAPGEHGPANTAGHRVWLCRGIGGDPELADIILDRVAACGPEPNPP